MFCSNCGKEIANEATSCRYCEVVVSDKAESIKPAPVTIKKKSKAKSTVKKYPPNPIVLSWKLAGEIGFFLTALVFFLLIAYFVLGRFFPNLFQKDAVIGNYEMPAFIASGLLLIISIKLRSWFGRNLTAVLTGGTLGVMFWLVIHGALGESSVLIVLLVGLTVSVFTLREDVKLRRGVDGNANEVAPSRLAGPPPLYLIKFFGLAIFCGGAYLLYMGGYAFYLAHESEKWPMADGTIKESYVAFQTTTSSYPMSVPLEKRPTTTSRMHSPIIIYQFIVDGKSYNGNRISFGAMSGSGDPSYAEDVVNRYPKGAAIKVHYQNGEPYSNVIEPGLTGGSWVIPVFGAVIMIIGVLFIRVKKLY